MSWRVAESLNTLLDEVNARAPRRSTASDGSIGDTAHSSRVSDHNPNSAGVVCARDITDDPPDHNATEFAEFLRKSKDPRIKYVIDQGRMFSSYPTSSYAAWTWRPYSGVNAHTAHTHISVQPAKALYDSTKPWGWATATREGDSMFVDKDSKGAQVRYWQRRMNRAVPESQRIVADGDYGTATSKLVALITGADGDRIGAVQADRIEQAVMVRALQRASANQADALDLKELAKEVADELTVTVKRR